MDLRRPRVCRRSNVGLVISIFCMDSLRFGSWKDFSLGWWNALASASMVPSVHHFESLTLWIQLRPGLRDHEKSRTDIRESWPSCPWQYFRSFDHGIVILSVFMAPDRVVLPASRNKSHRKLLTCFSGQAALGLSFHEHKHRNGLFYPFSFEDIILLTVDPGRVISNHRDSSRVGSCQLSSLLGGFRRFHLIISISTDYIPPLLTKYGVYNAVKCFSRNK